MTSRDEAISELMRRMREQRARLDPRVLELARQAAEQRSAPAPAPARKDHVPYDRKAAVKAIELFLRDSGNRGELERRLRELAGKTGN